MSYSLNEKCGICQQQESCIDREFVYGAICGIHSVNQWVNNKTFNRGHKGGGTITIDCVNFVEKADQATV